MSRAPIEIVPVTTRAEMDAFIRLPYRLHEGDPTWVPPLLMERREALDPAKNPFLRRASVRYWLARRDGRVVGRISAQMDPFVAKLRGPGEGHFGMIAAEDDPGVFAALTGAAEDWLRAEGATVVYGPFNLSINEETGLLVEGRETPPMMMMGHDPAYVDARLAEQGYEKARDLHAILWRTGEPLPAMLKALERRPLPPGVTVRPVRMKDYEREVRTLVDIFNDAWSENWGFVPLSEDEAAHMAKQLRPLIVPDLVWFAELDGKPIAFLVCLPNINEAIADLNGRLLPFGWAKLLWRLKVRGVKSVRVPLMGVRKEAQKSMLGPMIVGRIMHNLYRVVAERGIERLEMSWILEDNIPMLRLGKQMGGQRYKTYRMYRKALT